ncbi:MAG: hypothetical protein JRN15_17070 [Nitrososphaerota archaeon]|nr:hypothetical protein [Nitrososphaerota archaeon]
MDFQTDYEVHEIALIAFFFVFLNLNILDVFSTVVGIALHGFVELNPVGSYFISRVGLLPAMLVLKSLFLSLISASIYLVLKETPSSFLDDDVLLGGMTFLNVLGLFVLSNNFGLLGWPFFFQFRF